METPKNVTLTSTKNLICIANNTEIIYTIFFDIEEPVTLEFEMQEVESVEGGFNQHIEQHFKQLGYSEIVAIKRVIKQTNKVQ